METKDFPLFDDVESGFTGDTVMTVAVAEALLKLEKDASCKKIRTEIEMSMQKWGRKYPHAGYGGNFMNWLYIKYGIYKVVLFEPLFLFNFSVE